MLNTRRPAHLAALGLGLAGLVSGASGCVLTSPTTITTPYAASDGTNADLTSADGTTIKFRNFVLVSSAKDKPGLLVGAVTADGGPPTQLQLQIGKEDTVLARTVVRVTPQQLTLIGSQSGATDSLQVASVPVPPGSTLTLRADSASGSTSFTLPVVSTERYYSTISPSASASPSPPASVASSSAPASPAATKPTGSTGPSAG